MIENPNFSDRREVFQRTPPKVIEDLMEDFSYPHRRILKRRVVLDASEFEKVRSRSQEQYINAYVLGWVRRGHEAFLLQRDPEKDPPHGWGPPGGKIDGPGSALNTMLSELYQEMGIVPEDIIHRNLLAIVDRAYTRKETGSLSVFPPVHNWFGVFDFEIAAKCQPRLTDQARAEGLTGIETIDLRRRRSPGSMQLISHDVEFLPALRRSYRASLRT